MGSVYYPTTSSSTKIAGAQALRKRQGAHAHDEMLFIAIHQATSYGSNRSRTRWAAYTSSATRMWTTTRASCPSPHRLRRVNTILGVLVKQIDILETISRWTLDFRDMLRPASGFQSMQFKVLEAKLACA